MIEEREELNRIENNRAYGIEIDKIKNMNLDLLLERMMNESLLLDS
jgi:hypothetical protein